MSEAVLKKMKDAFNMTKQRCYNHHCRDYRYYGGRGITICQRWLDDFNNFVEDMGLRPDGMTLERKDNDGPYDKENCVWASRSEQSNNTRSSKRVEWRGLTKSISEWERSLGWKAGVLKARLDRLGYTLEEAFTKPVKSGLIIKGKEYPKLLEAARKRPGPSFSRLRALCPSDIDEAKRLIATGVSRSAIAKVYGVSTTTVSNAVDGKGAYR